MHCQAVSCSQQDDSLPWKPGWEENGVELGVCLCDPGESLEEGGV